MLATVLYHLLTDFDDDLFETMPFHKSNLFLWQIIKWVINTDTYACESPAVQCMVMFALYYLCIAFALDEAIVHGRLEYALRVGLKK